MLYQSFLTVYSGIYEHFRLAANAFATRHLAAGFEAGMLSDDAIEYPHWLLPSLGAARIHFVENFIVVRRIIHARDMDAIDDIIIPQL